MANDRSTWRALPLWRPAPPRLLFAVLLTFATAARAESPRQTEADAYTRYELLAPGSGKFRILYEVTATTARARVYDNPIRRGAYASDETVTDPVTHLPLAHETVTADQARADGVRGDAADQYLRVHLARPVPPGGGGRIEIDKTYADPKSYRLEPNGELVFARSLGIRRNTVVLPKGYELVACNVPSQVLQEPDGRVRISFWNDAPGAAPLELRARAAAGPSTPPGPVTLGVRDRAHETRDITYELQAPDSHAFRLHHEYTETRTGADHYINVVRTGSAVRDPGGMDLDTGEALRPQTLTGDAITRAGVQEPGLQITPQTQVVVFRYAPVSPGGSKRLRFTETYVDADRYRVEGGELVWRRSLGRAHNAIVLPPGWALSASSVPAAITTQPDGRVRLEFINGRPDEIDTTITAHRR